MIKIIYARNVQIDIKSLQNITMRMNVSFIFNSNQQFLDGNITSEIEIQFHVPYKILYPRHKSDYYSVFLIRNYFKRIKKTLRIYEKKTWITLIINFTLKRIH